MSALGKFAQQIAQAVTDGIGGALQSAVQGIWSSFLQFFYGFVGQGLGELFSARSLRSSCRASPSRSRKSTASS